MTCSEAKPYVSTLYDGERVPVDAAEHIEACPQCRETLNSYSQMGAEMRLMASMAQPVQPHKGSWLGFLTGRVAMPRFAVAVLVIALLAAIPASLTLAHAQPSRHLWFQFQLQPSSIANGVSEFFVAENGYDQPIAWMFRSDTGGLPNRVGSHVVVKSIEEGRVELEIAAQNIGTGTRFPDNFLRDMQNLRPQTLSYAPGQTAIIPIEGGGTLTLHGEVMDHQPKFASGMPLEPRPDQLNVRSPILLEGNRVLGSLRGGNTITGGNSQVAFLNIPDIGMFQFALHQIPGAVEGKANWGYISFKMAGKSYVLISVAPITGGDQPRTVWVTLGPPFTDTVALGSLPIVASIPGT